MFLLSAHHYLVRPALAIPVPQPWICRGMSFAEIEAELGKLSPDELRRLALKSWTAFVEREGLAPGVNECSEDDTRVPAALDEATARADSTPGQGHSASALRARLKEWTTR